MFAAIKRAVGKLPNVYATIGSNAPAVLSHILKTGALLKAGTLSAIELDAINLAVSEATGCHYCIAAHTMTGKIAGYTAEQTRQLRDGSYPTDARIDTLVKFALGLVNTRGTLESDAVEHMRKAGFSDGQLVEAALAVSAILLTNMINRINDTTLDFLKVD
jgi:AhpD family alkylhydroperoxidase